MRALASALLAFAAVPAAAATYSVGPGQPLAAIGDVPWATLAPGDEVLIHWRSQPYREKWVICRQGTQAQPIVVRGVPGPGGVLPVIDGADAITAPGLNYWSGSRGIIKIGGANTPPDLMPRWIVIEGLDIRAARNTNTFTDDDGSILAYDRNASSIYLEYGENVIIRGCDLHDCGNGLFVASGGTTVSRDILIEGNHVWDAGNVGSIFEHSSYTAAIGITFHANRYGPLLPGAGGNSLKDRSAGLVVSDNYIEGGNRQLDLVDGEDSSLIVADPSYRQTFVHGNVLVERDGDGNRQVVHYGGDSGQARDYRKGILHFYNNTVVSYRTDRTTLFRLSTNEERCDARNNIVWAAAAPGDTVSLIDDTGVLDWSHQVIAPGWRLAFVAPSGTLNDDGTSIEPADPGFADMAGRDFHLIPGSPAVDAATTLHPSVLPDHDLLRQYAYHQADEPRPRDAALDVGAFELDQCGFASPPGLVTGLRVARDLSMAWVAGADADSWDVARGALPISTFPLAGATCVEVGSTDAASADAPGPGSFWYAASARNCAGRGSWDSGDPSQLAGRDAALAAACP